MTMNKDIRWRQRFVNFEKAFLQFKEGIELKNPNKIEKQGIIKTFEYSYELAWNTLKDYLESKNIDVKFPRDTIKQAIHYEILDDGELWMDMLDKRNLLVHTYDEKTSEFALRPIKDNYYKALLKLNDFFKKEMNVS